MEGDRFRSFARSSGLVFQSTPSAWRETDVALTGHCHRCISIHSLRMEGDHRFWQTTAIIPYFNPLPPHGGRPADKIAAAPTIIISIHSLRMEGDSDIHDTPLLLNISIHSLRMEGDLVISIASLGLWAFQSTPSAWRETSPQ